MLKINLKNRKYELSIHTFHMLFGLGLWVGLKYDYKGISNIIKDGYTHKRSSFFTIYLPFTILSIRFSVYKKLFPTVLKYDVFIHGIYSGIATLMLPDGAIIEVKTVKIYNPGDKYDE